MATFLAYIWSLVGLLVCQYICWYIGASLHLFVHPYVVFMSVGTFIFLYVHVYVSRNIWGIHTPVYAH